MYRLKSPALRAITVAVVVAAITALTMGVLFASYVSNSALGEPIAVFGVDALRLHITEFGVLGFITGLRGYFAAVAVAVLVGCILHHQWMVRRP